MSENHSLEPSIKIHKEIFQSNKTGLYKVVLTIDDLSKQSMELAEKWIDSVFWRDDSSTQTIKEEES
jgi:hypothetical protein